MFQTTLLINAPLDEKKNPMCPEAIYQQKLLPRKGGDDGAELRKASRLMDALRRPPWWVTANLPTCGPQVPSLCPPQSAVSIQKSLAACKYEATFYLVRLPVPLGRNHLLSLTAVLKYLIPHHLPPKTL